jgi:hypothetical protein
LIRGFNFAFGNLKAIAFPSLLAHKHLLISYPRSQAPLPTLLAIPYLLIFDNPFGEFLRPSPIVQLICCDLGKYSIR